MVLLGCCGRRHLLHLIPPGAPLPLLSIFRYNFHCLLHQERHSYGSRCLQAVGRQSREEGSHKRQALASVALITCPGAPTIWSETAERLVHEKRSPQCPRPCCTISSCWNRELLKSSMIDDSAQVSYQALLLECMSTERQCRVKAHTWSHSAGTI